MKEIVIIGGSDTGISTALRIREINKDIKPLIISDNHFPNYSICGIPFYRNCQKNRYFCHCYS